MLKAKAPIDYSLPTMLNCFNISQRKNAELNLKCNQKDAVIEIDRSLREKLQSLLEMERQKYAYFEAVANTTGARYKTIW